MFIRASPLFLPVLALSSVVTAAPATLSARDNSCSSGAVQCCNSVFSVRSRSPCHPHPGTSTDALSFVVQQQHRRFPFRPSWHCWPPPRPSCRRQLFPNWRRYWCQLCPANCLLPKRSICKCMYRTESQRCHEGLT